MPLTRQQARDLDQEAMSAFGVPGVVLMENAGRGMAELLYRLDPRGPVTICCGGGNNGGDGLVMARHLDNLGMEVHVILFAKPTDLPNDAGTNFSIVERAEISHLILPPPDFVEDKIRTVLTDARWIVDACFGSGLRGPLRPPFDRIVRMMNHSSGKRFAVDLPSGMDADTGIPAGACVQADVTATVVAKKAGFISEEAQKWLGEVHVIGMGAPRKLIQRFRGDDQYTWVP